VIAGDDVRIVTAQGRFTDPLVGSGKTVRLQGATLGGTAASNYVLQIATPLATRASIQSRPLFLSGSFEAEHKLHDGTTKAVIRSHTLALGWVAPTDNIQFVGFTAEFEDANVGNDKVVYLRGGTISGTGAANYHLGERLTRPTANANILPTTPPSAPRKVTGTIVDGRLQLTWELPADEGCREVTGYLVELSTDDGASWTRRTLEGRTALATALQGLELNVRHRVRVASVNVCGTSDWAEVVGSLIPVAPIATPSGIPSPINGAIGGTAAGTTAGRTTFSVEADSLLSVLSGKATLALKGTDEKGESLPVDSTGVLLLEQGGHVLSSGSGFAPGTVATLYLFGVNGAPSLLATVPIKADGTFDLRGLLAADLPPARYVIQVNGRAADRTLLSISMLVEVAEPPAELVFTSVPSVNEPTVGDTITLTLTVTNSTDGAATDVVIPRAFDERGFKLVRARAEQGTYDEAKREWTISRIGAHAQARLVLTVIVLHTDLNGSVGR
jgi:hypothetical protein